MKRWVVMTPEYGTMVPILDDGSGPIEYGYDAVEVEAESRRDALILGVKLMRANPEKHEWFDDNWSCPYTGIKVEECFSDWSL